LKYCQNEYTEPQTEYSAWAPDQKTHALNSSKAMNILCCLLDKNKFNRVYIYKSSYEI
jgi:hypothetical protein